MPTPYTGTPLSQKSSICNISAIRWDTRGNPSYSGSAQTPAVASSQSSSPKPAQGWGDQAPTGVRDSGKSLDRNLKRNWGPQPEHTTLPVSPFPKSHHQMMTQMFPGLAQGLVPQYVNSIRQEITYGCGTRGRGIRPPLSCSSWRGIFIPSFFWVFSFLQQSCQKHLTPMERAKGMWSNHC